MLSRGLLLNGFLLVATLAWLGCAQESPFEKRVREAAKDTPRPLEGRLSTISSYQPWQGLRRQLPDDSAIRRQNVSMRLRGLSSPVESTARRMHLGGLLRLFENDLPGGLAILERTAEVSPSPAVLADLAAAYLAVADEEDSPWLLVDAAKAASVAATMDPQQPQAVFNLALTLERMHLDHQAAEAWQRFIEIETDDDWLSEASLRLNRARFAVRSTPRLSPIPSARKAAQAGDRATSLEIANVSPRAYRELIERELFPAWSDAAASSTGGSEELAALRTAATATAATGDRLYLDGVAAIDESARRGDLAAAQAEWARGLEIRSDCRSASPFFERAAAQLEKLGSPMALTARLELSICRYRENPAGVEPELRRLARDIEKRRYPALLAKVQVMTGLSAATAGRHSVAMVAYRAALDLLRPRDEERSRLLGLLDEASFLAGDRQSAWRYRLSTLEAATASGDRRVRHATLMTMAQDLAASEGGWLARQVVEEMLANAKDWGEPGVEAEILLRKLPLEIRAGSTEVDGDLAACRQALAALSQPADRERLACELEIVEAEHRLAADPASAASLLEAALGRLGTMGYGLLDARALLALGRARVALGDGDAAAESFGRALEIYESRREQTAGDRERVAYFATAQEGFDAMIRLQAIGRGDARAAFLVAERIRARGLRDRFPSAAAGRTPTELHDRLDEVPADAAVLSFVVLPERLLVFRLRRGDLTLIDSPVGRKEVAELVRRTRDAFQRGNPNQAKKVAGKAFRAILGQALAGVPPETDLFMMPDRELYGLPFSALYDDEAGRFVVEDHAVTIVSSLEAVLRSADFDFGAGVKKVLVVGDPAFDDSLSPGPKLPGAAAEAREIALLYGGAAELLTGPDATASRILKSLPSSDIFHLAAHVQLDPRDPLASIILTAAPEPPLRAADLDQRALAGVNLVYLSACDTAPGFPDGDREGAAGLVRAAQRAGIPFVVATLWPIEDRDAAQLTTNFYERLISGDSLAQALRQAQRNSLERLEHEGRFTWPPFNFYGD